MHHVLNHRENREESHQTVPNDKHTQTHKHRHTPVVLIWQQSTQINVTDMNCERFCGFVRLHF